MLRSVVVLSVIGCGSVSSHGLADAPPGSDANPGFSDGGTPGCPAAAPFTVQNELTSIDTNGSNECASLSDDGTTLWFSAGRAGGAGGFDIYAATRTTPLTQTFMNVGGIGVLNSSGDERCPRVTQNGLTLFASDGPQATQAADHLYRLVVATRADPSAPFTGFAPLDPVNGATGVRDAAPYIVPDGHALYFVSDRMTAGVNLLFRAERTGTAFGEARPVEVQGLPADAASNQYNPVVTPDELTLYFQAPSGEYVATRGSTSEPFHDPTLLTDVVGPLTWISADNCQAYLVKGVASGTGTIYHLYYGSRAP